MPAADDGVDVLTSGVALRRLQLRRARGDVERRPGRLTTGSAAPATIVAVQRCNVTLAMNIADLLDDADVYNARNADCSLRVHGQTFNCHRLILGLVSSHLQTLLDSASEAENPIDLDVPEVTSRAFEHVVRFAYRGTVEPDIGIVGDLMAAGDALLMPRMRSQCVAFMTQTLGPDNCLRYWSYLESYDIGVEAETKLYRRCHDVARSTFCRAINSQRPLAGATDSIVETLLRDPSLQVRSENQVCEVLLKWLDRRRTAGDDVAQPCRYLSRVRWSGVDSDYVHSTVIKHPAIKQSREATSFMSRVMTFHTTGTQFDGIQTSHRLATRLERSMLTIVSDVASPLAATMYAVSAQLTGSVELPPFGGVLPFAGTPLEASSAVVDATLYVVGLGDKNDEIWAYDASNGWRRRCGGWGGLAAGRRRHSVVAVDGQYIYTVAGYCPRDRSLVSFVERFDPTENRNFIVDGAAACLPVPVLSAAAAAHNSDIYVFGGTRGNNEQTNIVQSFSTRTGCWTTLQQTIPPHFGRLAAILYNDRIIVIGADLSAAFSPDTGDWAVPAGQGAGGGSGVSDFGLVVDDGRLYVLGGRRYLAGRYTTTDEVKSVDMALVCGDGRALKAGDWHPHGRLPRPSLISVCGVLSIPTES